MSTIKIKQVKSRIGAPADQKRTLDALEMCIRDRIRPLLLQLSLRKNTPYMVSSLVRRRSNMLMMKSMSAISAILYASWKLVL